MDTGSIPLWPLFGNLNSLLVSTSSPINHIFIFSKFLSGKTLLVFLGLVGAGWGIHKILRGWGGITPKCLSISLSIFLGEKKLWYAILDELKKNPNRKLDEIVTTAKANDPDLVFCPVSELPFALNHNLDLWLANEQPDEIAITSQFKIENLNSESYFQGMKFDGSGEKLHDLPKWAKKNLLD